MAQTTLTEQDKQDYIAEIDTRHDQQMASLHETIGIRKDQEALWETFLARVSAMDEKGIDIYFAMVENPPERKLGELEMINASQLARAEDLQLLARSLEDLYPHLDTDQRSRLDNLFGGDQP